MPFQSHTTSSHHHHQADGERRKITNKTHNSILDFVGNTPIIKLNRIPKKHGVSCEIYAKCEFLNPGGSIKDRIALSMMQDAQKNGMVHANTTLVEPTSGNTGIGIAFNCALSDNNCIIVTEEKNSAEKVNTIRLLGAEVIQVTEDEDEMVIAHKIRDDFPDHIMLNQFDNKLNPKAHYDGTGLEIVTAMDGDIDMVVMGAGTGGTITGVGTKVKENCPNCKIVVAEPAGSIMFNKHGKDHSFLVEGIGGTWVPMVLDKSVVDEVEVANDEESFLMARELARKEGLLCVNEMPQYVTVAQTSSPHSDSRSRRRSRVTPAGAASRTPPQALSRSRRSSFQPSGGSSGTAMVCAIKVIKRLNLESGKRVVVILPDGIRNYMSKFVSDQWMEAHLFMDPPQHTMRWWNHPITALKLKHTYPVILKNYSCERALAIMKSENIAVVIDDNGQFVGAVSKDSLRNSATNPTKLPGHDSEEFNFNDPVTRHLVKHVRTLAKNGKKGMPTIGRLSRILDITPFVVIGAISHEHNNEIFIPEGVTTGDDVLDYIYANYKCFQ